MLRKVMSIVAVAVLFLSGMVSAHENFRIIGTIVKFENWRLDVKTRDGETFGITLQQSTPIQRDKKWVTSKELKVGRSVVVDVMGDTLYDTDLYVSRVTLVPPIAPARTK
jgi:hypothetical protein